jgi:trk system potassium uptake protein TrkH
MKEKNGAGPAKRRRSMGQTQFLAFGFFVLIMTGTLLLMLPFSSRDGRSMDFLGALFTATSASCVTGLVVADTWTQWSLFGQLVIITMIQIGGLGFITIGVYVSILLRRKIGLKMRGLMQESTSALNIGGIVRLAKKIIIGTILFEGGGALLLAIRFIPQYGFLRGIFYSIFHAVSAFCNAGFDLMGHTGQYNSLSVYYDDWLVNLVIMSLIIIGGIGFVVWDDISKKKLHFSRYLLQTKIVLITTAVLVFGGGLAFYLLEKDLLMADMDTSGRILSSLFSSVTARTAGFNTIDTGALSDGSKLLTIILMFIGGSPGSTAGGIKTTTVVVLFLFVNSSIQRTYGVNAFGRRLDDEAIRQASSVLTINLFLALGVSLVIMGVQNLSMSDTLFETFSAIGTAGMTTGITRDLVPLSRFLIILLMYCGRIGSMSFALSFTQQKRITKVKNPMEQISVG